MNALELLGDCERDLQLAARMIKGATRSRTRHGDFIVARGAAERLVDTLKLLIDGEETGYEAFAEDDPEPPAENPPWRSPIPHLAERPLKLKPGRAVPSQKGKPKKSISPFDRIVLEVLKKAPAGSSEVHQSIAKQRPGTPIGSVYTSLSKLRALGMVSPEDGKQFLTKSGREALES